MMDRDFPFDSPVKLGQVYVNELEKLYPNHGGVVVYPLDVLKCLAIPPFMPLDTHLTDAGTLVVLRVMLETTRIATDELDFQKITESITNPITSQGDLGSKIGKNIYQTNITLLPKWKFFEIRSPGGFNDGMVDMVFSPSAKFDKTVLLFGDSFFRMMLRHMSGIFTKIICLRTRFFHLEMIEAIKPDVIFSGNAERYLSNVESDSDAPFFPIYPAIKGLSIGEMPPSFVDAYNAFTSPKSKKSGDFFHHMAQKLKDSQDPSAC